MNGSQSAIWSRWDALLVLILLAGAVWLSRLPTHPPDSVGLEAPDSAFSADRAMEHLRVIARAPHLPGSPEHARVREYLIGQLSALGLETEYQNTTWLRDLQGTRAVALWNVLGRLPGTDPSGTVLLMAHYDPVPHSCAANDDGTSVAAILETIRALRSGPALENDLIVFFSDGEELGRMGSRAFVAGHRWFPDVSVVVNLEIRAEGGASWMFETGAENGWVVKAFARADPHRVANSMTVDIWRRMSGYTDYASFRDAGVQGLNFSTVMGANTYHLVLDNLEHTSLPSMQHQGLHALSMVRFLGNADLTETKAPDVVFASVPILGFIHYPPVGNWVGVFVAVILICVTLVLGRRRGVVGMRGVLVGCCCVVASLLASAFVSAEGYDWLRGVHPEYGLLQGRSFHVEGWYFLSVVVMSWTVFLSLAALLIRWVRLYELALGGNLLATLGAIVLVIWMPLTAMNLVWPCVFGTAGLLWYLLRLETPPRDQRFRAARLLVLGIILLPVLFFLAPMTELLWQVLGISQAPVYAVLATVALILILPLSAPIHALFRWRAPAMLGFLWIVFLIIGISLSNATEDRPTPARLFYTVDRDEGRAWWATADRSDTPWIRERVPNTEVQDGDGESVFFPTGYLTADAAPVVAEAPAVEVVRDTIVGDRRVVRLSITSRISAEVLNLRPGEGVESILLAVNDRALERSGAAEDWTGWPLSHWGDPGGGVGVEFSLPADAETPEFLLRETCYRPAELLGPEAFRRPSHLIPSVRGTSDVAVFGTKISF